MKQKLIAFILALAILSTPKVAGAGTGVQRLNPIFIPIAMKQNECNFSNCIKATQPSPIPTVYP